MDISPLFVFILTCILYCLMLIMNVLEWYDNYRKRKTMFIKDKDWLLMEDNTKDIYNTSFAKTRYVRPGSYIQDVSCYQPVYNEKSGVIRIIDNSDAAGEPCSVSPITLSDELKETIKKQKGEN